MVSTRKLSVAFSVILMTLVQSTANAQDDYLEVQPAIFETSCIESCLYDSWMWYRGDNDVGLRGGGWTQLGAHSNETPRSVVKNDLGAFNDHAGRLNLHQQWLWVEKDLCDMGWGDWTLRGDLVYGTDAQKTQAFGGTGFDNDWDRNGGYGWALPQLFAELRGLEYAVRFGHFYTIVGYEVVQAPQNFFYSHSLTMFNAEPFTHTGALAEYYWSDNLTIYGGWTAGWDTGFESENDGSNFLGGFSYSATDYFDLTYIATAGNFGAIGDEGYSHSIVAEVDLTNRWQYVFQTDMKRVNTTQQDAIGINQYLFYDYNENIDFGARIEWWKRNGFSYNEATFGVNVRLLDDLIIRPEIRHDWQPHLNWDQTTVAMDAIWTYSD